MQSEIRHERRQLERFELKAHAVVETMSPGLEEVFELHTRDVSSGGAFFPMEVPLPTGQKVKIAMYLSISALEHISTLPSKARITTEGQVVRACENGIAVEFEPHYAISAVPA